MNLPLQTLLASGAVLLAVMATGPQSGSAEIISGTITGTIVSGNSNYSNDYWGFLGASGVNYAGQPIDISYYFDTSLLTFTDQGNRDIDVINLATPNYPTTQAAQITVTIGGLSFQVNSDTDAGLFDGGTSEASTSGPSFLEDLEAQTNTYDRVDALLAISGHWVEGSSIYQQPVLAPDYGAQFVDIQGEVGQGGIGSEAFGFTVNSPAAPAPEPWSLALLATGAIGARWASRTRRHVGSFDRSCG